MWDRNSPNLGEPLTSIEDGPEGVPPVSEVGRIVGSTTCRGSFVSETLKIERAWHTNHILMRLDNGRIGGGRPWCKIG